MACGRGNGNGAGGLFNIPNFGGDFNAPGLGLPFNPELATAGLRGFLTHAAPFFQNIVGQLDEQMVEEAIRQSMGDTGKEAKPASTSGQFKESVVVDKTGKKYGVEIVLGADTKPESLKISRKDNVLTIDVKMEKMAEDGSSRLYQEYTRRITLPENVDLSQLESSLSPAGVLTIQAPFFPKPEQAKPACRIIPVIIEDDKTE